MLAPPLPLPWFPGSSSALCLRQRGLQGTLWLSSCRACPDPTQAEAPLCWGNPEQFRTKSVSISFVSSLLPRDSSQPIPHVPGQSLEKGPALPSPMPLPEGPQWRQKGKVPGLGPSDEGKENRTGAACRYNYL